MYQPRASRSATGGRHPRRAVTAGALLLCLLARPPAAAAQAPAEPFVPPIAGTWEPVRSLGQPPRWKPFVGVGFGMEGIGDETQVGPSGSIGIYRDFLNPVLGLLGGSAQIYVGQRGELFDAGARTYLSSPAFFLHGGADWNARLNRVDFVLSATVPTTRGGWFRRGGELRVDWVPRRQQSVTIGASLPVAQPLAGRTRPRRVNVSLPRPPAASLLPAPAPGSPIHEAVAEFEYSMQWITTLHNIFWLTEPRALRQREPFDQIRQVLGGLAEQLEMRSALVPGRNTYEREIEHYHGTLERAFTHALGKGTPEAARRGGQLAELARHIALVEVILPYNRTIGQYKKPDVLDGLVARARARFVALPQLEPSAGVADALPALQVFDRWMHAFEQLRQHMAALMNDSRMHWLPLALVLRQEEHDSQDTIDRLVELALGRGFSSGNATLYINAPQFQSELQRTVHEAEDYHVLWIHDYRGRNELGEPDRTGYAQTVEYMRALLNRVRAYDEAGRLPVFILMVDQHSYEINHGRLWFDLLERPLDHRLRLPADAAPMQAALAALQDSLRLAVTGSRRMRAEIAAFGPQWPAQVVKVHVNVTNPSDFSFRSSHLLGLRVGADNLMRDHRKIVIRDVTEADPSRGEVILAGVGIGEKYTSSTWEDRGVVLQGPAALEAKSAARQVLEQNGLRGDDLPHPLRPLPFALDYAQRVSRLEADGATARVLQAHNVTGWGEKDATFIQMLLYDLAPSGTVIYVPDSLWTNYEWLAQLVSAALRGCTVLVVAPARDHAPSTGFPQMSVMQELITRLVLVKEQLGSFIAEAGGDLHVGLYTRSAAMDDLPSRLAAVDAAFHDNEFLPRLFPLSDRSRAVMRSLQVQPVAPPLPDDVRGRPPLMHRKTQLIADRVLLARIAEDPAMPDLLVALLNAEHEGFALSPETGPLPRQQRLQPALRLKQLHAQLPDHVRAQALSYLMVGSLNKDVRSMALDGEALAVVADAWALQAWLDFVLLSGAVTWLDSREDADALLPPYPRLQRWIGRLLLRVL